MDTSEIKVSAATVPGPVSSSTEQQQADTLTSAWPTFFFSFPNSESAWTFPLLCGTHCSLLFHLLCLCQMEKQWLDFVLEPFATETLGQRNTQEHGLNTWDWQSKDIALLPFIRKSLCVQIQAKYQPVSALSSLAFVQCPKNCLGQIINKWQSCPSTQSLYL